MGVIGRNNSRARRLDSGSLASGRARVRALRCVREKPEGDVAMGDVAAASRRPGESWDIVAVSGADLRHGWPAGTEGRAG